MKSILTTIKKMIGFDEEYVHFDTDIITHINSALFILNHLGVGTKDFSIKDKSSEWEDFIDNEGQEAVKSFIFIKVKLVFDPPQNSFLVSAMEKQLEEYEWRLFEKHGSREV